MKTYEAAELIEAIAKSIRENPNQFQFQVNITGTRITSSGGGTGLSVQAIGGGSGSQTIGFQSSLSGANIEIAQTTANATIQQEMSALVETLNKMASELHSKSPDKSRITAMLDSLKQSWVPQVITAVVANIITQVAL